MREDPAVLQKRMGVADVQRTGRRITNMGDKRRAGHLVSFGGKGGVLPGRDRLLVYLGPAVLVEDTQARAVRVPPALLGQAVGGVQQPECRGAHVCPCVQAKESTHDSTVPKTAATSGRQRG